MEWPKSLYELPRTLLGFHVAIVRGNHRRLDARKSIEERLARLEVEAAARHLLNHYAYCYDAGDLDGMMDVYSDDCLLINRLGTFKGAEAIRANYERAISERTVSFHHIADIEVYPSEDASEAWVTAYIHNLAVRRGDPGGTMATCVFHMRHGEDGGWKFSESRIAISDQHSFLPRQVKSAERSDGNDTYPDTVAQLIDDLA